MADLDQAATKARPVVKVPKPTHAITIAADQALVARLKVLASVMPKSNIRFVKATTDNADFTVSATLDDPALNRSVKLFTDEVHIIAGSAIHAIVDLQGKVVSFGPVDGPTRTVARKAFGSLGISVKETSLDFDNAFDGLATGDIDAVVVLAPQPSDVLKRVGAPGLHLVEWPAGAALPSGAVMSKIAGTNYPHLAGSSESIRAVGVEAVLNMSARGAKQPVVRKFFATLSQHSAALSKQGFNLLKADVEEHRGRRVASAERR